MSNIRSIVLCADCYNFVHLYLRNGWSEISGIQPPPGDPGNFVLARFSDLYEEQAVLEA